MQFASRCKNRTNQYGPTNYPLSYRSVLGQQMEIFGISGLPIAMAPCLHQCKVYIKRKLRVWRAQNAFSYPVQKPHRPVPSCKLPVSCSAILGQQMEILGISGLPITMAPCLHQCKVYIKRKLWVWRAQNAISYPVQKLHRLVPSCKLPRVMQCHIEPAIKIFGLLGLPIAMVLCLHQRNVYIKRKLRVWRAQNCHFLVGANTAPTGMGQQTTPCHTAPYWASKWKFLEFRVYLSPWYRVYTNAAFILKGSYGCGEPKNVISLSAQRSHRPVLSCKPPRVMQRHIGPANGNFWNFGATYRHGTVFAPMQCLY